MSALGKAIACEAKKYVGIKEVPTGSNRGPQIDPLFRRYYGSDWDGKGKAYCAIWVWVVVDDVLRRMQGSNPLPDYRKTWGNARNTLQMTKGVKIDGTPAVGSAFYRYSTSKSGTPEPPGSGGSSGHMGIVVDVLSDGTILTVEANQGESHQIAAYRYGAASYRDMGRGFQFIHVETVAVRRADPDPACKPIEQKQPGTGQQQGSTTTTTTVKRDCHYWDVQGDNSFRRSVPCPPGFAPGSEVPNPNQRNVNSWQVPDAGKEGTVVQKQTIERAPCVWNISLDRAAPHYSAMKNPLVASDIIGGTGTGGRPASERNGRAIGQLSGATGWEDYSGFGWFTDRLGNRIIVVRKDDPKKRWAMLGSSDMQGGNLLGGRYGLIKIRRRMGSQWRENETEMLGGRQEFDGGSRQLAISIPGHLAKTKRAKHVQDLLEQIESDGIRYDVPIVIQFMGEPTTIGDVADFMLGTAVPFAISMLKIPLDTRRLLQSSTGVLRSLIRGNKVDPAQLSTLVKFVTPTSIHEYVDAGATAYDQAARGQTLAAIRTLGLQIPGAKEAEVALGNQVEAIIEAGKGRIDEVLKSIGSEFAEVQAKVQTAVSTRLIDKANFVARDISVYLGKESGFLTAIPEIRGLWTSGSADTLLPAVPRVNQLMSTLINEGRDLKNGMTNEQHRAFSLAGLGFPTVPQAWDELLLSALRSEASDVVKSAEKGLRKMLMPGGVREELRECFAKEITKDTGVTVIDRADDTKKSTRTFEGDADKFRVTVPGNFTGGSLPTITRDSGTITTKRPDLNPTQPTVPVTVSRTPDGGLDIRPELPGKVIPTGTIPTIPTGTIPRQPTVPITPAPVVPTPTIPTGTIPNIPPVPINPPRPVVPVNPPPPTIPQRPTVPIYEVPPPPPNVPPTRPRPTIPTGPPPPNVPPVRPRPTGPPPPPNVPPTRPRPTIPTGPPPPNVPPTRPRPTGPPPEDWSPVPERPGPPPVWSDRPPPEPTPRPERPPGPRPHGERPCYPGFTPAGPPIVYTLPLPRGEPCGGGCGGDCGCDDGCGCHGLSDRSHQRRKQRRVVPGF